MKDFKIRCSAIGKIMAGQIGLTEKQQSDLEALEAKVTRTPLQHETMLKLRDKQANPELPQTVKSYCEDWLKEQLYGKRKEFQSKYTQKGLIMEDEGIDLLGRALNREGITKNEQHYSCEFMDGTPDVDLFDTILDNKCSWDCFTFPLFDTGIPNTDYWWQGQGYMHLTGAERYILGYTLVDTPLHIITKQAYYFASDNGLDVDDVLPEFIEKMTYTNIPDNLRVKLFEFAYDPEAIKRIEERVKLCRKYIETLLLSVK